MPFTDPLKELVLQGASAAELKAEMIRGGMQSLRMAGIAKILEGMTTPEEILRMTVEDRHRCHTPGRQAVDSAGENRKYNWQRLSERFGDLLRQACPELRPLRHVIGVIHSGRAK